MIFRMLFMVAAVGCVLIAFNRALEAASSALEARRGRRALKAIEAGEGGGDGRGVEGR